MVQPLQNRCTSQNTLTLSGLDSGRKIGAMSHSCRTLKPVFLPLVSGAEPPGQGLSHARAVTRCCPEPVRVGHEPTLFSGHF